MQTIKKLHLADMIDFAIKHVSEVEGPTLLIFQEYVFAQGNYGEITLVELMLQMQRVARLVQKVHVPSLLILAELLGIPIHPIPPQLRPPYYLDLTTMHVDQVISLAA